MRTKETIFYSTSPVGKEFDIDFVGGFHERSNKPLDIGLAGITLCDNNYHIRRTSRHNICAIIYVISGRGTLICPKGKYHPQTGDVFITHSHSNSEYFTSPHACWRLMWFNFKGPLIDAFLDCYNLQNSWFFKNCPVKRDFAKGINMLYRSPNINMDLMASFCLSLIQNIADSIQPESKSTPSQDLSLEIKEYLDLNYKNEVTLEQISAATGYSVSHVIRIFKTSFGITPYQYLLERRISTAKIYLISSCKNIKEIAYELGFNDEFHFSTIFKRKTGVSPQAFRTAV